MDIHLHFSTIFWSFLLIYCCSCAKYNRPTRERITAGCPFGYLHYQSACYKVSGDFASFAAAEAQCAADGGFLAVPDDQASHEHLVKLASARYTSVYTFYILSRTCKILCNALYNCPLRWKPLLMIFVIFISHLASFQKVWNEIIGLILS